MEIAQDRKIENGAALWILTAPARDEVADLFEPAAAEGAGPVPPPSAGAAASGP